jgi:hypothetical protein
VVVIEGIGGWGSWAASGSASQVHITARDIILSIDSESCAVCVYGGTFLAAGTLHDAHEDFARGMRARSGAETRVIVWREVY